jgi:hypothetical protein
LARSNPCCPLLAVATSWPASVNMDSTTSATLNSQRASGKNHTLGTRFGGRLVTLKPTSVTAPQRLRLAPPSACGALTPKSAPLGL